MAQSVYQLSDLDMESRYSYADYLLWKFRERVELIQGKIRPMAAPGTLHQEVSGALHIAIGTHLKKSSCKIFAAPFDVRLTPTQPLPDGKIYNVVQPDLVVVCDPSKLDSRGCMGAPDLVIEILSPGNNRKEVKDKYELYQSNGVPEYWLVSPVEQTLLIYVLQDGIYSAGRLFTSGDIVTSAILPGFSLDLNEVFNISGLDETV